MVMVSLAESGAENEISKQFDGEATKELSLAKHSRISITSTAEMSNASSKYRVQYFGRKLKQLFSSEN